ncbi:helix-turn-helix transcriptional regulator [Gordonia caeni]|uniref:YafY family protein n=1 Tax=Gordonia caeni TaxID=1007097 RepID=A0ABP7PJY6_9ACTN
MSAAPSRFSRLLAMVPYFQARPGIKMSVAAAELGVTEAQLDKDLNQLWVCGLPGGLGGDLIDIEFGGGYVNVHYTAGMDRPLRLTGTEANILLVALRMLLDAQGALDADAIRRAIAKIEEATGASRAVVIDDGADPGEHPSSATIREAVARRRALRIRYYTPSRDEVTERVVDPIRVQVVDSHSYLDAWCRESDGRRLFRFDRVQDADLLDEPARPPADVAAVPISMPTHDQTMPVARIEVDPEALWVIEYYQARPLTEPAGETEPVVAEITYASPDWLARLLQSFGGRVRLISTDEQSREVRGAIAGTAAAARARYAD